MVTMAFLDDGDTFEKQQMRIGELVYRFRIPADVIVIETSISTDQPSASTLDIWNQMLEKLHATNPEEVTRQSHKYLILADIIRQYSSHASCVFVTMGVPPRNIDPRLYMMWLEILSDIQVPFCFIRGNGQSVLSWTV